jgi:hypothetical protein
MRKLFTRILVIAILAGLLLPAASPVAAPAPALAQAEAPTDTPTALVTSGVTKYTLAEPKIFWYSGVPICPPPLDTGSGDQSQAAYYETIKRVATFGSTIRVLYYEAVECSGDTILSDNIVSDGEFLYWLSSAALMKLSTDANIGDDPQPMNYLVNGYGEVADGGDKVFVLYSDSPNYYIDYVRKDNNQRVSVTASGSKLSNLQWDGKYVYYLQGSTLYRKEPGVGGPVTLATGVTGYYPEGKRLLFCTIQPFQCFFSDNVYVGQGQNIRVYDNLTEELGDPIYTSVDPSAVIYSVVTDFSHLFFFESREAVCDLICTYVSVLQRTARSGGVADSLYTYPDPDISIHSDRLTTDGEFLFWHENDQVLRLPNDASAMPVINMTAVSLEVTQGVQDLTNSVLLIKDRRTFVRAYVKSGGDAVSGVTAYLYAPALGQGPLLPANPDGKDLTVHPNPDRDDISQSFLFELPWSWVADDNLDLLFVLNPHKVPLEPNYGDNSLSLSLTLNPSPTFSVEFFRLNYRINGVTYSPRLEEDLVKAYSWMQRAYPLGGSIGEYFKPRGWDVDGGEWLGGLVNRTDPICGYLYGGPKDDPTLCASYVMNGVLWSYRIQTIMGSLNVGLNPFAFYYGMITDASGNFARGQAAAPLTSVGPTGIPSGGASWDTDGSYGDWYAAHEIGHSLGRAHPNAGSDDPATPDVGENCNHSRSDPGYPYGDIYTARTPIGPYDHTLEGFDVGDAYFGIPTAVFPSDTWNDVMSYCSNQWISDYTYEGMYYHMIAFPSLAAPTISRAGDFLLAAGVINPASSVAGFSYLRRVADVINVPALVPGDYSLRLLDASNNILADYAFTPVQNTDLDSLDFAQVVDFEPGTRQVQVVELDGNVVLATQAVSANPPSVSNVALQDAPDPVTGVVTLAWTASDPDAGDTLSFDIVYSRDNGVEFQPVAAGLTGSSAQIDTASLGGSGTALLRVIASDGVNSAYADSAPFIMANKPPDPIIFSPENGLHIHYGQLVNFSGMALDAQDGNVADSGLVWWNSDNTILGYGPQISVDDLPVGANNVSLVATNSVGTSAIAFATVYVDDDLNRLGPTLAAGPSPVGWQVNNGSSELQTAEISINNVGSGDLDWSASDDAAWLSTSVVSDTVTAGGDASTLTLSADPSGLASDKTYSAHLTLTSDGLDPVQTVMIHVTLSVGDVHSVPIPEKYIFLPMVRKQ